MLQVLEDWQDRLRLISKAAAEPLQVVEGVVVHDCVERSIHAALPPLRYKRSYTIQHQQVLETVETRFLVMDIRSVSLEK